MIGFINCILFLIRCLRLKFQRFQPIIVNGKEDQMWNLCPGDHFTLKGEPQRYVATDWPIVCWWYGDWGIMTVEEDELELYRDDQRMGLHADYPKI